MRILVTYATGFGATAEVAREIADVLGRRHTVDLKPMVQVHSLEPYGAVVVGSSLRAGRWLGPMYRFFGRFKQDLGQKPFAIFAVALSARTLEGGRRVLRESLPGLLKRYPGLEPLATEAFGGVLDYDKYNPLIRAIMRKNALQEGLPTAGFQDFRDWESIRRWAAELGDRLAESEHRE